MALIPVRGKDTRLAVALEERPYLYDRGLLGNGLKVIVEDSQAYDVQSKIQEDFLHVCCCLHQAQSLIWLHNEPWLHKRDTWRRADFTIIWRCGTGEALNLSR